MHSRAVMMAAEGVFGGASKTKRSVKNWTAGVNDQDTDIEYDMPILRQRSRDLEINNSIASGILNNAALYTVGKGPRLHPQIDRELLGLTDEDAEKIEGEIKRHWNLFAESVECDVERTKTLSQMLFQVFFNEQMSGDIFTLITNVDRPGSPFSLKLQTIEADLCQNPGNQQNGKKHEKSTGLIYDGVEKDPTTKEPLAYWFAGALDQANPKSRKWTRKKAFNDKGRPMVLHYFRQKRPGASRGVPMLAPVMAPLKQLGRYKDAELMAAVIQGMFTVFIKSKTGKDINPIATSDQYTSQTDVDKETAMGYGAIVGGLSTDDEIELANPNRPSANYDPFVSAILREIGMCIGQPYEVMMKVYNSSYSAARAALIDAWRTFETHREDLLCWLKPVYAEFFTECVSRGMYTFDTTGFLEDPIIRKAWLGAVWVWPGRDNIRPDQEVKASKEAIDLGLATRTEETARRDGGDYTRKARQRKKEAMQEREIEDLKNPANSETEVI